MAYEAESLWSNVWVAEAEARLKEIAANAAELSKSGAAIPYNERVMLKWEDHVLQHHDVRIAA